MTTPDISTAEGRLALKQEMLETLLHHLELDKKIGDLADTSDSKIMAQARLARRQYKEHAELILELLKELTR